MITRKPLALTLALSASLLLAPFTLAVYDRTADEIIAEITAVKMPSFDRERDQAEEGYRAEYYQLRTAASQAIETLVSELYETHPNNEKLVELLPRRWGTMRGNNGFTVIDEAQAIMDSNESSENFKLLAAYWKAQVSQTAYGRGGEPDFDKVATATYEFIDAYPEDTRNSRLLSNLAAYYTEETADAAKIWQRLLKDYPDDRSAKYWPGKLKQASELGKPFNLAFTDAITGTRIDTAELKGKVVVLDFWATWCGPCIAEMPKMKELYAEYKNQNVEFIGISLDHPDYKGGLDALKKYCAENKIPWPQYYQGNWWSSDYSVSWGINSIPAMFVIDRAGNLHSVSARGKLETMIPELLGQSEQAGG